MHEELSELQRDALTETINIGVGRASRALAKFAESEVAMSVPIVIQAGPEDICGLVDPSMFNSPDVCAVARRIVGLDADVVMIFQASRDSMSRMSATAASCRTELAPLKVDLREDVARRIGGLLIESCLDQVEVVVGRNIDRAGLAYFERLPRGIFGEDYAARENQIVIKLDIKIAKRGISGHLLCAMTHKAANKLAEGLDALVAESAT